MSGICGIFNTDSAPVAAKELRAMTAILERRGPEGSKHWTDGPVGLGHTLLATTPELSYEKQPFRHAETGCVIAADVRLDNREDLLATLEISDRISTIGDAELILLAYLRWGESCPQQLLGDFAFAIWDARQRSLFCARDHFGMRPFYYHHQQDRAFLFASEARAILVLPRVPYRLNDGRIADFIVQDLQWIDYTSTFFEGIYRLPPGHTATVTRNKLKINEYWRPEPGPDPGFTDDEDYREGFLEVFTQAVEARLRTPSGSAASMLSGGMDSGSVVAVAADVLARRKQRPLATISAVTRRGNTNYPAPERAEAKAIYAATSMPGITPTLIYPDQMPADFDALISDNEEPFDTDFLFLKAIFMAAQRQGEQVVLDGAGGDSLLSAGTYVPRLLRQCRLRQAFAEIAAEPDFYGFGSFLTGLANYTRTAITPDALRQRLRGIRLIRHVKELSRESLVSQELAAEVDLLARYQRMRDTFGDSWHDDYAAECSGVIRYSMTAGRERYARLASSAAVEARDPFMDKRVVDYCSILPGRFRQKDGWPKMILRDLMAERLPQEVLWCRQKPHLGWLFNAAVTREAVARDQLNLQLLRKSLRHYADEKRLEVAWQAFADGGDAEVIHQAYVLSIWLQESAQRPVSPEVSPASK